MYRDWSGNWDLPFLKTAGDINAAGLEFPLTKVVGAFQVYIYEKLQQYWFHNASFGCISFSDDLYQEWGVSETNLTILFMSNCRRSLELCSRKVIDYSELTELLWKHEKLMMRVLYDGGLV